MNEEQAIFDFFSRAENLPLALSVAEQMDELRKQMNNRFWRELRARLDNLISENQLGWQMEFTEDKTSPECLVGLHCTLNGEQAPPLCPMIEQQYSEGAWRIYFGLIWNTAARQQGLAAVNQLQTSLQKAGFRNNENFLAWQWTTFHPRSRNFLLNYARQPDQLLDEVVAKFSALLIDHRTAIEQANEMLVAAASRNLSASLEQLRNELLD